MIVGSTKENLSLEKRVSLTPETAKNIIGLGLEVCIEKNYAIHLGIDDSEYKKIGVQIKIEITPPSILRQGKATGKFDAFRASWIADYPNVENYFSLFYSKNHTPKGPNYTFFSDLDFDELYELIGNEKSILHDKISNDLENIIRRYSPIIPLYYDMSVRIVTKNISGLKANATNQLNLKRVVKKL